MRYSRLFILIIILSATAFGACASNELTDDVVGQDIEVDANSEGDASQDAQAEDTRVEDVQPEIDTAPFCRPSDNACADENTTRICAPDGSEFVETACAEDEECVSAACVTRPICDAGEKKCYDASNLMTCRPGGTAWRTETCDDGTTCVAGACVSGAPNGAVCAENSDCANALCRCGAEESCSPIGGEAVTPYCSAGCTPGSCGSGEVCASAQDFPALGQDHCVPACNQTCALDGMTCASIPTRDSGSLTFEQACVPEGVVNIGLECSAATASACAGGTCLDDVFEVGLCTSTCTGDCPDGTACVQLKSGDSAYYCSPICGDGTPGASTTCPLDGGRNLWSITCKTKSDFNGLPIQVCAKSS